MIRGGIWAEGRFTIQETLTIPRILQPTDGNESDLRLDQVDLKSERV